MPAPKLQRWIDLLAALLRRRFPATFDELAREVPAYHAALADGSDKAMEALERMFERDKDELRAFGIPIRSEVSSDGDTHGYRLTSRDFYLPYLAVVADGRASTPKKVDGDFYRALRSLTFEPDELAAVAEAAARVAALGDPLLAGDARCAMRKLAFDLPADAVRADAASPHVDSRDRRLDAHTFEALGDALLRRKTVAFDYWAIHTDTKARRTVDPYGLFFLGGHWYLVGHDHERDALRNFRVARIGGVEVNTRKRNTADYDVPAGFDLQAHARARATWELGDAPASEAVVEFRTLTGPAAAAAGLGEAVDGAPSGTTRRRFVVRRRDAFARWLLSFAGDVVPVEPLALVEDFRRLAAETLALYDGTRARAEGGA
jgi:proteasome accessory factor B